MTRFRPCIDLHAGRVKQIVGGTLSIPSSSTTSSVSTSPSLITNHISPLPASHFAALYRTHALRGAHVIMLGPGNEDAARAALAEWPGGLQVGGGLHAENVGQWVEAGAEKVILTSYLFPEGRFARDRLEGVVRALGGRERLVVDLSCRRVGRRWVVAMDKWQRLTDMEVNQESVRMLEAYCSEFLVHAADHEGLQRGIDEELVQRLGEWCSIPVTYAGGGRSVEDLEKVRNLSKGKVDLTIGSALDVFGGEVRFEECVAWNKDQAGI